jgi:hypothetical protein
MTQWAGVGPPLYSDVSTYLPSFTGEVFCIECVVVLPSGEFEKLCVLRIPDLLFHASLVSGLYETYKNEVSCVRIDVLEI